MKEKKNREYRGFQEAGVRLAEETLPDIVVHSSAHERSQLYACHMFDKAHLVALAEEKIIPSKEAALMLASLREMEAEGIEQVRLEVGGGIHSGEKYLINRLSEEVGGKIHLGRSSGDIDKVADRIKQRDELLLTMEAINDLREVLLHLAEKHVDVIMPGYTHGQHAQVTTLGHQLLAWAAVLERDFERLEGTFQRVNVSPAGAAIMTGSNFPINRHRTSELLGFDTPCRNTLDAVHSPDTFLEVFSAVAVLHTSLARWADDLIFWSSNEIGMVELPDRFCGTSSILVQKKNPYALEHIRGAAAETVGGLMTAFFGEKGPTGLSIFSRNRYAKQILWRSFENIRRDLRWLIALMPDLKIDRELMARRAGAYWAQATDIAGAMVRDKGVSWRTAHQISGILIRLCHERRITPDKVAPSLLDEAAVEYTGQPIGLSEDSLRRALDPVQFVKERTLYGGPAPEESKRRIREFEEVLQLDRQVVSNLRDDLNNASQRLERAIDDILEGSGQSSDPG